MAARSLVHRLLPIADAISLTVKIIVRLINGISYIDLLTCRSIFSAASASQERAI